MQCFRKHKRILILPAPKSKSFPYNQCQSVKYKADTIVKWLMPSLSLTVVSIFWGQLEKDFRDLHMSENLSYNMWFTIQSVNKKAKTME